MVALKRISYKANYKFIVSLNVSQLHPRFSYQLCYNQFAACVTFCLLLFFILSHQKLTQFYFANPVLYNKQPSVLHNLDFFSKHTHKHLFSPTIKSPNTDTNWSNFQLITLQEFILRQLFINVKNASFLLKNLVIQIYWKKFFFYISSTIKITEKQEIAKQIV